MDSKEQACDANGKLKSTTTQTKSLQDTGQTLNESKTLQNSHQTNDIKSTLSAVASPAKICQTQPIIDRACGGTALVFGGKCYGLLKESHLPLFASKMLVSCVDADSQKFCGDLPSAGMMRNGQLYQQVDLDLPTDATDCLLLPTPTASTGSTEAIMNDGMHWIMDARLMPRRVHVPTGGTFSAGLSRLTQIMVFLPVIPQVCELLMGFPIDWTDLKDAETQSCHKSQNLSDEQLSNV